MASSIACLIFGTPVGIKIIICFTSLPVTLSFPLLSSPPREISMFFEDMMVKSVILVEQLATRRAIDNNIITFSLFIFFILSLWENVAT